MPCTLCACLFASSSRTRMHCWTCSKIPLHPRGLKYLQVLVIWVSDALGDDIFTHFLFSLQLLTAAYPFLPNHCFTVFLRFSFLPPTPLSPDTVLYLYISLALSLCLFLLHATLQMPPFPHISFHSFRPQVQAPDTDTPKCFFFVCLFLIYLLWNDFFSFFFFLF